MMSSIFQAVTSAIASGYTAKSILQHIARRYPKAQKYLTAAQAAGFSAPSILKKVLSFHGESGDSEQYMTEHERTLRRDKHQRRKAAIGLGLAAAAPIGGLYALGRGALARAAGAIAPIGPVPPTGGAPPIPPATPPPGGVPPAAGGQISPKMQAMAGSAAQATPPGTPPQPSPQTAKILTPEQQQRKVEITGFSNKFPSKTEQAYPYLPVFVKKNLEAGKTPDEVYSMLQSSKMMNPILKKIEEETGISYLEKLKAMQGKAMPVSIPSPEKEEGKASEASKIVITPVGAGKVHKEHAGNAYVEVDNKLRKVPVEELEEPSEDVRDVVQKLLNIPEEDRSSNVSLFTYDPDEAKMYIQFHDGTTYKYLDMNPETVYAIARKEAIPITEGENIYGAWSPEDKKSLGAALWKYVLKDPKYAKPKKDQPANPFYKKLETLYDYWAKLRTPKKKK